MTSIERAIVIRELEDAGEKLKEITHPLFMVSDISLAYAQPGARTLDDIAVFFKGKILTSVDLPVCRMVLTAMRFDSAFRSVAVLNYSEEIIRTGEKMLLEIGSFNRVQEPPGLTTLDWGVAFCCEKIDGVPDLIYDTGCAGKDPLIRLMGENPTRVLASINRILTRIIDTTLLEE